MKRSTVTKSVLASIVMLNLSVPVSHAQGFFAGMMSGQPSEGNNPKILREITDRQAEERFRTIDLNHDGVVNRAEFVAAYGGLFMGDAEGKFVDRRFRALDMKNDGRITQAEFVAGRNILIDNTNVTDVPKTAGNGEAGSANLVAPAAGGDMTRNTTAGNNANNPNTDHPATNADSKGDSNTPTTGNPTEGRSSPSGGPPN